MRRLLLSAVVLCVSVFPSMAGSLKDTEPLPVAAPEWYGPYVGVHAGGAWSSVDWAYTPGPGTADHDGDGAFGGVQAGYNFRTGSLVYGIEGDISAAGISGSTACPNDDFSCHSDIRWLGSVRLRAGFTTGPLLVYGTGGFGFGRIEIGTTSLALGTNSSERTATGWTAGGGVEFLVDRNWTIKAEYLYYDLGDDTYTVDNNLRVRADTVLHTGKVGFNYRF
ncbi:MAG TPA: outer membrane protein [Hyphomicrobiaceae bacterium]|nr:outer membrane protein [Hyphomicrobiaceae bacterium]